MMENRAEVRTVSSEPGPVGPHDPVQLSADALDGGPGPGIADVGLQADPMHPPHLEGVLHHEELRFGVDRRTLGRSRPTR